MHWVELSCAATVVTGPHEAAQAFQPAILGGCMLHCAGHLTPLAVRCAASSPAHPHSKAVLHRGQKLCVAVKGSCCMVHTTVMKVASLCGRVAKCWAARP